MDDGSSETCVLIKYELQKHRFVHWGDIIIIIIIIIF